MSCDNSSKSEALVYLRRAKGGGTGSVIWSWDYYEMASLPTNDNVRYSVKPESKNIPLHEIGNNRYHDVICKSTHIAYKIGGDSRTAAIRTGDGIGQKEKNEETTNNPCVYLFVSSKNFYERLPECWPWSCRRWTKEIKKNDKDEKVVTYFAYSATGGKNSVASPANLNLTIVESDGITENKSIPLYKVTKNDFPEDEEPQHISNAYLFYKTVDTATGSEEDPIEEEILNKCGCEAGTVQIKLATEFFPVLCDGVCKLVIKFGYLCYSETDGDYVLGKAIKKLISPFWTCRINEYIYLFDQDQDHRPLLASLRLTLDGTETKDLEVFDKDATNKTVVVTGQDYNVTVSNDVYSQIPWNKCDKPRGDNEYIASYSDIMGKAEKYLSAHSRCCDYCTKADQDGQITYFVNSYCTALDSECSGESYVDIESECGGGGGSSAGGTSTISGGSGTDTTTGALGGDYRAVTGDTGYGGPTTGFF